MDAHKLTVDPRLLQPGNAGPGHEAAAAAYRLRDDSPAIGAGIALPNHPTRDFAGRPVKTESGRVTLGAMEPDPRR